MLIGELLKCYSSGCHPLEKFTVSLRPYVISYSHTSNFGGIFFCQVFRCGKPDCVPPSDHLEEVDKVGGHFVLNPNHILFYSVYKEHGHNLKIALNFQTGIGFLTEQMIALQHF